MVVAVDPEKVTLPVFAVKVPPLIKSPKTDKEFEPATVSDAAGTAEVYVAAAIAGLIVMLLTVAAPLIIGIFNGPEAEITASIVAEGRLVHQLLVVRKSVLVSPVQIVWEATAAARVKRT